MCRTPLLRPTRPIHEGARAANSPNTRRHFCNSGNCVMMPAVTTSETSAHKSLNVCGSLSNNTSRDNFTNCLRPVEEGALTKHNAACSHHMPQLATYGGKEVKHAYIRQKMYYESLYWWRQPRRESHNPTPGLVFASAVS